MYDQNQPGQQPMNNQPFGQPPMPADNGTGGGMLGVNHDQNSSPPPPPPAPAPEPTTAQQDNGSGLGGSNDLLSIKQDALQQLSPLVGQLDQSPEEKFKTTMMMIQASDDQKLVKDAYEAAKQIPDEKARAQALLDVVNEINYFTQHNNSN
jgi:hypothetical protein